MAYVKTVPEIKIGTKVRLTRKVKSIAGYFLKGDIVKICDIDAVRGYGFEDELGNKVIECGWHCCESIK
jgi:hypothetical protein